MSLAEIYTPTRYLEGTRPQPVIFLAGPIQGTRDWQSDAVKIIAEENPFFIIANPRREYLDGEFDYGAQVDWETFHIRRATKNGAVMFWLAKETEHDPTRAYAQTSKFELAELKVRHEKEGIDLVIGIEPGFSGERYIRRRFGQDCPDVLILDNLRDTCIAAVSILDRSVTNNPLPRRRKKDKSAK